MLTELAVDIAKEFISRLEESDKAISARVARDPIAWTQSSIFFQLGIRNPEIMKQGFKMYANALSDFQTKMVSLVSDFRAGLFTMDSALSKWKEITSEHYQKMFRAGAAAIGNPYYDKLGLTDKDLAFIAKARRQEMQYFKRFLSQMQEPGYDESASFRMHPPLKRAMYYADSGKAQFFNGMVNGAGDNILIDWVMDICEHCEDCPVLAAKTWTWKTLPTVPRAGDTQCLFRCRCHLEFRLATEAPEVVVPGSGTLAALKAIGRWSRVFDSKGSELGGQIVKNFDDLYQQMYKARQMIELTSGPEQREWIDLRRAINRQIIDLSRSNNYRSIPTVSVRDLVDTVNGVMTKYPNAVIEPVMYFNAGDEVIWVRGNAWNAGMILLKAGRPVLHTAKGIEIPLDEETDILFLLRRKKSA